MKAHLRGMFVWLSATTVMLSCGPSVEDQVAELAAGRASNDDRQALLLAKERAVNPLLEALAAKPGPAARRDIVRVLAGLMMRTEDKRIEPALLELLRDDPDTTLRADLARRLGLLGRTAAVPSLLAATGDPYPRVRQEAVTAIAKLRGRWGASEPDVKRRVQELARDTHLETRVEALILRSHEVQARLRTARQAALSAEVATAESLLVAALDFAPGDKRAAYDLGRLYLDNGQVERGQQVLRTHGMLLDVPALSEAPAIDGRLTDPAWTEAAHTDSFWLLSRDHEVALSSELRTDLYVGWRPEGLYVGMVCWDKAIEALVVGVQFDDDMSRNSYQEDRVELFFDSKGSRDYYVQLSLNSIGANQDGDCHLGEPWSPDWDATGEWAAAVEDDHWSAEMLVAFGGDLPRPEPSTQWGGNFVRCYRGQEFLQWTRTSLNSMRPDQFGLLVFR